MRELDALIVSTGRAASTAVYRYLDERADLSLPVNKEPHHWCDISAYGGRYPLLDEIFVPDRARYEALYKNSARMIDASVGYFFTIEEVISRLDAANQRPKVIFLYREPLSRAASLFNELKRKQLEEADSLIEALQRQRAEGLWWENYYDNVNYYRVYLSLIAYFPRMMAINYHAFANSPGDIIDEIMRYLGIEPVRDISYYPVNSSAEAILRAGAKRVPAFVRRMSPSLKGRLIGGYRALREFVNHSAASLDTYLPRSLAEYREFREVIDYQDIVYASRN